MKTVNIEELDVIFITYDEPNAEKNWVDLLDKIPWAQRVHGVYGSDAAHKAAANLATTERFITVDGDNVLVGNFLNQTVEVEDEVDLSNVVFSWPSKNIINGLMYGNGGIKCWPRELVLNMKTHENADPSNSKAQVDFCWDIEYKAIENCYSEIKNNASPLQAWRAGFREGVKMSLNQGDRVLNFADIWRGNFNRLVIWMSVGRDVTNGIWSILGARQGCYLTNFTDWDFVNVRDFKYLNDYWEKNVSSLSEEEALAESIRLGNLMKEKILGLGDPFSPEQSLFFKSFNFNPDRQTRELKTSYNRYDIVMITYDEPNAEENWVKLKNKYPNAKRVDKVKGIHNAHKTAASIVETDLFWVVDGDSEILESFKFNHIPAPWEHDMVKVWRSQNPVNGLVYGYGGVKLLPKYLTLLVDVNTPDMTTSISKKFSIMSEVSNTSNFNTDPFSAWKSGFRECCKLASKVIDGQVDTETEERLKIWCSTGQDQPFGEYAIKGAIAGKLYGEQNKNNKDALKMINDFNWLKAMFDEQN
jgi:hypothetical protein